MGCELSATIARLTDVAHSNGQCKLDSTPHEITSKKRTKQTTCKFDAKSTDETTEADFSSILGQTAGSACSRLRCSRAPHAAAHSLILSASWATDVATDVDDGSLMNDGGGGGRAARGGQVAHGVGRVLRAHGTRATRRLLRQGRDTARGRIVVFFLHQVPSMPVSLLPVPLTPPIPPPPSPQASTNKYDRQLRLWGASGQESLALSHALLIGSSSSCGTELLKNLVLPGLGGFTVIDTGVYPKEGEYSNSTMTIPSSNFFAPPPSSSTEGKSKAEVISKTLNELNPEVVGGFHVPSCSISEFITNKVEGASTPQTR